MSAAAHSPAQPPTFAEVAPRLEELGYEPVPVRPGGKKPGFTGWTAPRPAAEHIAAGRGGWGTGILAARTPALDIDVHDARFVRTLFDLATATLGPAPIRIGRPPKALLPYRTEAPFAKRQQGVVLPGETPEAPGYKPHKLELLASGQQWCCYAVHPGTGRPYAWYRGEPLGIAAGNLTPITESDADRFMAAVAELLARCGARVVTLAERPSGAEQRAACPPRPVTTRAEAERIADALRRIPTDGLTYDDWIRIGLALKGALGEAGWPLWRWWSAQHPDNRPEDSERKWRSFKPGRIGAGTIFHLERRYGR